MTFWGLGAIALTGCAQVLGLGDYRDACGDSASGGSCETSTSSSASTASASPTSSGSTAASGSSSSGTGGAGPTCSPPLTTCGAACVDLSQSSDHCHQCGHSCGGGLCVSGVCQPETLASGLASLHAIDIDDTHLYFSAGNLVQRCAKGGPCSGGGLAPIADFTGQNEDGTGELAVAPGLIVFVGNTAGSARLYGCPSTGCTSLQGLGVTQNGYLDRLALASDGTHAVGYVFEAKAGIESTSCTGASCTPIAVRQVKANSAPPLAATNADYFYEKRVSTALTGVAKCPASEPTCATVTDISSVSSGVSRFVVTPTGLFILWAGGQGGGSAIGKCPVAGCASAGAPMIIRSSITTFDDMTALGDQIFWVEGGVLRTCPSGGCAAPVSLATGIASASHLVADMSFV